MLPEMHGGMGQIVGHDGAGIKEFVVFRPQIGFITEIKCVRDAERIFSSVKGYV
jgi:hypothetical protein